eukprot:c7313_g1_i1.p1 GENE.c7313_g1_i1~~c7313_g1_i1.p1  ORF type:complete len:421 (-),score=111.18 c7313_g1_i1:36-1298(-)
MGIEHSIFAPRVKTMEDTLLKTYTKKFDLKYGCNPSQSPSSIYSIEGAELPFQVLHGKPGYINLLDAVNAWQLVHELKQSLNLPAAASFKHVSPAGAGLGVPLTEEEQEVYEVTGRQLSDIATAYVRARNADPKSSFGDFVALSDKCDLSTAELLKIEVSDGIIAPAFDPEALEILIKKKSGSFVVLQANPNYQPPAIESREVFGVVFVQKRNDLLFTTQHLTNIKTKANTIPPEAQRDLVLASISLKFTQSNSVGYALNGQMIGVGAGQQSRIDCTKLAGSKVDVWRLRFHPKVRALAFPENTKRQDRINARVSFIETSLGQAPPSQVEQLRQTLALDANTPLPLITFDEFREWRAGLTGVSLSSDAFFPFRDNIDAASQWGVKFIAQPGGSVQDEAVTLAADQHGMAMAFTDVRLFHH